MIKNKYFLIGLFILLTSINIFFFFIRSNDTPYTDTPGSHYDFGMTRIIKPLPIESFDSNADEELIREARNRAESEGRDTIYFNDGQTMMLD